MAMADSPVALAGSSFPASGRLRAMSLAAALAAVTVSAGLVAAQDAAAPPAPAAAAAPDAADLSAALDTLVERLEAARVEHDIPGMAIGIVADGEPVLLRGFGTTSVDGGRPVDADTLFAIGSSTKSMTGVLCSMLVEDGRMSWDDPVRRYVPNFRLFDEEADAQVNVRDLLVHDLGVMRTDLLWYGGGASWDEILDAFATAEPVGDFRGSFNYQNIAYAAAGRAAASAAGAPSWDAVLEDRLLEPLGMEDAGTSIDMLRSDAAARGHARSDEDAAYQVVPPRPLPIIGPAGAVNAHVRDMCRYLSFLLARGVAEDGTRLLSEEAVEALWNEYNEIAPGTGYGLGWMLRDHAGRRLVEHGGNIDRYAATMALLPDDGLGFVLLTNSSMSPLQGSSIPMVFDALLEARDGAGEAVASTEDVAPMLGEYAAPFLGEDVMVTALERDGGLALDVPGQMVFALDAPDDEGMRSFRGFPIRVQFVRRNGDVVGAANDRGGNAAPGDDAADVVELRLYQGPMTFELPRDGYAPEPEIPLGTLAGRLGRYTLDEAGVTLTVQIARNRLAVDVPGEMLYELRPPDEEGWWDFRVTDAIRLRFEAADGTVMKGLPDPGETPPVALTLDSRGNLATFARADDDVPLSSGDEVMERILAAHGAEAYDALAASSGGMTIRAETRLPNQGLTASVAMAFGEDGRMTEHVDFGVFGTMIRQYEADGGTAGGTLSTIEEVAAAPAVAARATSPLAPVASWRTDVARVEVVGRVAGPAKHADAAEVADESEGGEADEGDGAEPAEAADGADAEGGSRLELRLVFHDDVAERLSPARVLVEEATGRVLEITVESPVPGLGRVRSVRRFADHREVLGVLVPFTITDESMIMGAATTTVEAVEAGVATPAG